MIQHVSIGARDIAASKVFYDAIFAPLGYTRRGTSDTWLGYGKDRVEFSVRLSATPVPSDPDSGLHFCFVAPTRASVAELHTAALAHGGKDNGAPGLRVHFSPTYYSAYVIDPDGYRLEVYCGAEA
jgi:catechol 2,3-dioxygenase-like lactoylglutathione lyase family enzyme